MTNVKEILETGSIANRAMKFKLSRGGTARRIRDKDAEALVKSTLGDEGQIVSRELFKDKGNLVYQYQALGNEMYTYHIKSTLPFGDDSARLLPNMAYFDYTSKMGGFISQLSLIRTNILNNWDSLVQADMQQRNTALIVQGKTPTAKAEDYPTRAQMEHRLYVNWYPEPVSTVGDFRFTLPPEILAVTEKAWTEAIEVASRDRFARMLTPVTRFIEKLNKYTGDKGQKWHDSFIDNLAALSKEIPTLNILDDPKVDEFLKEIDSIIKPYVFQPDALKEDPLLRADVKSKLEALEAGLKGYAF